MTKDLIIEIKADTKEALKEIEELKREIKEFSENIKKGNVSLKTQDEYLNKVAKRLTQMAHAYAGFSAIKGAINIVADFEQAIAKLGAISGASGKELESLQKKAEELGKSTQFSASEVAEGMNYLAMAGYKTKDILASIGDILNLAQVGMIDLARAADIASNILSGFGMSAEETKRVVDVMTATITNANTNIPELGEAMKYVAPQAKALGVSLEETATAIGILSNAGIKATMAGTGLSTMLVRLASPTGAAADAIKELGIQIYDANGKFVGLANILRQFKEKMASMSQEMKAKYIRDIFGLETMKTAITLIDSIGSDYDELYKKIANSMDISEKKAKQMSDTFKGHLKELESAFQGLIIVIGNELLPTLTDFVKWLSEATQNVEEFYSENKELINVLVELTAIFIGLGKIRSIIEGVLGAKASADVVGLVKNIKNLKVAFLALGSAILKLTRANAILLALSVAIEGVSYAMGEWEEKINRINEATQNLQESTKSFNEFLNEIKKHMDGSEIKASAKELEKLKNITKELIKADEKRIEKLKELLQTQKDKSLKRELDELIKRHNQLLAWYEKLKNAKPYEEASKSAKNAKNAVRSLTEAEKEYIEELRKDYEKRVTTHEATIEKLKAKEEDLANKILQIQKDLQERLKELENDRVLAVESIENKIHSLKMSGASEYEKYIDTKKQADIAYTKAKGALQKGEFELAKHYMSEYESLISSLANKEIKENGKVLVSKEEANRVAINGLKQLETLTNEYYAKEKEKAKENARAKLEQLKSELSATKAQLKLEVQRLNLEKQMIELLTGKKVDIDTTEALKAIKNLDEEIKALDEKIKEPRKVKADTSEAQKRVSEIDKKIDNTKAEIKVKANTQPALAGVLEIKDKINGEKEVIKLYADNEKAKEKLKDVEINAKNLKPLVKVNSDISQALNKLNQIPKTITTIHYIKTVETHASGGIAGFKRVSGKIPGDDPLNSDDVPALLTRGEFVIRRDAVKHYGEEFLYKLNAKMLPKFATGGLVEIGSPSKLITYSSNSNSVENTDLISKLEEMITILEELLYKFNGSEKAKEINSMLNKLQNDAKNYEKKQDAIEKLKESIRGKTLKEEEYNSYKQKLSLKAKELESYENKVEKDLKKAQDLQTKLELYLREVEKYKNLIRNRINRIGIDENLILPDNFDYILDLNKLKNFYNKLVNISIEDIQVKFSNYMKTMIAKEREFYYGWGSIFTGEATTEFMPRASSYEFLKLLGINNSTLAKKIPNFDYRVFGNTYSLPKDIATEILIEYLKENLPKFRAGGLIALQNGGKLPGYGGGDRNLALLEDGEFVIRKEAVRHFGVDLFSALNSLKLPKFQIGGIVGDIASANTSKDVMNINFKFPDGKSFEMQSDEVTAKALESYLKRMM